MKTILKVFIGCIVFMVILGQLVDLGALEPGDKNLKNIELAVRMDMEDTATKTLNYPSTFDSGSFFLIGNEASLFYSGQNAFGVESSLVLYADVEYDIETTEYKITNIRKNK